MLYSLDPEIRREAARNHKVDGFFFSSSRILLTTFTFKLVTETEIKYVCFSKNHLLSTS